MSVDFTIDGAAVTSIESFYDEINRLFMADEQWRLGASLDALDDLLYGGYGALLHAADVRIVWTDHEKSREALGRATTAAYYRDKLRHPEVFDQARFRRKLVELEAGDGATYFEMLLEVFGGHPEIDLVLS